jgi:menaquinone-9 beta-reductase
VTEPPEIDALVVGAGPAGAAAATSLARSGLSVVVVDKARFPRDKTCGDGLTTGALRELADLGFDRERVPSWQPVDRLHLSSPSRHTVLLPLPRGPGTYAAIARRVELDVELVRLARRAGAEISEGETFAGLALDAAGATVQTTGPDGEPRRRRVRYVVAADGTWSPVRRALQLDEPGYRGDWHAFRQYVTGVSEAASRDLYVWFEPDFLPGYLWSFPLAGGAANIGFGIHRGGAWEVRDMARLWPELLARPHVRAVLGDGVVAEGPHRAWPIPARVDRVVAAADRVLFVGDALAATDPLTGEGIAQRC